MGRPSERNTTFVMAMQPHCSWGLRIIFSRTVRWASRQDRCCVTKPSIVFEKSRDQALVCFSVQVEAVRVVGMQPKVFEVEVLSAAEADTVERNLDRVSRQPASPYRNACLPPPRRLPTLAQPRMHASNAASATRPCVASRSLWRALSSTRMLGVQRQGSAPSGVHAQLLYPSTRGHACVYVCSSRWRAPSSQHRCSAAHAVSAWLPCQAACMTCLHGW